jgi:hypothetical protein
MARRGGRSWPPCGADSPRTPLPAQGPVPRPHAGRLRERAHRASVPTDERIGRCRLPAPPTTVEASVDLDGSLDALEVGLHLVVTEAGLFGHAGNAQRARVDQNGDQRPSRGDGLCRGGSPPSDVPRDRSTHSTCAAARPRRMRASPGAKRLPQIRQRGDGLDRWLSAVAMEERSGTRWDGAIGTSLIPNSGKTR